ncbi:MAG: SUMF1/EgtB/PvdO family nonheme iron enzyme [Phycisphaerae bacterium]|nr:SUMF1/EgtB/PvdO family nonheme iron enzyme [Phycisphaerae bacterium]
MKRSVGVGPIVIGLVALAALCNCALAACPSADFNGDCFVDFNDFALLATDWPAGDYNDFALMAAQWLAPDPRVPYDMVSIPAGTFQMGDSCGEGDSDELPVHAVMVDSFFMGKYEVTNQRYCDYLNSALAQGLITVTDGLVYQAGSGTSYQYCDTSTSSLYSQLDYNDVNGVFSVRTKSGRNMSNDSMVQVSWYGAAAYCNWRSQQEGKEQCYNLSTWDCDFGKHGYRLPTEAEWEYAARGGLAGTRFPWGDTISHSQANYRSYWEEGHPYYFYDVSPTEGYHPTWNDGVYPYTSPVGSFAANGYGLYDMAGNVVEFTNDWYSNSYYSSSPTDNPTGPASGSRRVHRSCAWYYVASYCRVAIRHYAKPSIPYRTIGFRLVLDF